MIRADVERKQPVDNISQQKCDVSPAGVEPATFGTANQRSIQLSYEDEVLLATSLHSKANTRHFVNKAHVYSASNRDDLCAHPLNLQQPTQGIV